MQERSIDTEKQIEYQKSLTETNSHTMDAKAKSCAIELAEDDSFFGSAGKSTLPLPSGASAATRAIPSVPVRSRQRGKNKCPVACALNKKRGTMKQHLACRDSIRKGAAKGAEVFAEVAWLTKLDLSELGSIYLATEHELAVS